jgi:hypothetical protein
VKRDRLARVGEGAKDRDLVQGGHLLEDRLGSARPRRPAPCACGSLPWAPTSGRCLVMPRTMAALVKGKMVYSLRVGGQWKKSSTVRNLTQEQARLKAAGDKLFSCSDTYYHVTKQAAGVETRDVQLRQLGLVVRTNRQGKW